MTFSERQFLELVCSKYSRYKMEELGCQLSAEVWEMILQFATRDDPVTRFVALQVDLQWHNLLVSSIAKKWDRRRRPGEHYKWVHITILITRAGHLKLLKWLFDLSCYSSYFKATPKICMAAAEHGHQHVLEWARKNNCRWDANTFAVATKGYLELLKWLKDNGCPWDANACYYAALGGHYQTLKWMKENQCNWDEQTCAALARRGDLAMLKWAREQGCPWNESVCGEAAGGGHMELLQWAREEQCPWDDKSILNAAIRTDLEMLQWIWEKVVTHTMEWFANRQTYILLNQLAAKEGLMEIVLWLHERRSLMRDETIFAGAASGGHLEILKFLRDAPVRREWSWDRLTLEGAARNGHLEVLQWAWENGCNEYDERTFCAAAIGGHLDALQWMKENFKPLSPYSRNWNSSTTAAAAEHGQLETLQWLIENGCPWTKQSMQDAARTGQLEVMEWLHQKGLIWNWTICWKEALKHGQLHILKWNLDLEHCQSIFGDYITREQRLHHPHLTDSCLVAAKLGHQPVLQWVHDQGLPWDESISRAALEAGHQELFEWLIFEGCPIDPHISLH